MVLLLMTSVSWGQSSLRQKHITVSSDTLILDTLTIYESSFRVMLNGKELDQADYYFDGFSRKFKLNREVSSPLTIEYRVFPIDLSKVYSHKSDTIIFEERKGFENPYKYTAKEELSDFFGGTSIKKSGSISRGVSFGNNQDLSVNSTLNLQLSGQVTNNLKILASVSDDNIPIQPDGNTNKLQEFDQVFIQLYNDRFKLIAGDFWLKRPKGYFMNYNKRAQGLTGEYYWSPVRNPKAQWKLKASGAFSKGKFSRNVIQGVEGNQGPYRLRGNENEPFIIILAGTENVYIDGRLLERGQEHDYTINYNTSEVIFTPRVPITKDSRIVVEFQYSDQNYARSLVQGGTTFKSEKWEYWLNIYSEQDAKNQTIQQDLSSEQKELLASVGDSVQNALSPSIDSIGYFDNQVLYFMRDSLGHDSVLVYNVHADSAHYRAVFSFVGQGNGDYVFDRFTGVGRVYKWVQPVGGVSQGDYAPVRVLIAPKKRQMVSSGFKYNIGKRLNIETELAYSNNDINTFSRLDQNNDRSFSGRTILSSEIDLGKDTVPKWQLHSALGAEFLGRYFTPIERFRSVEFERNWNIRNVNYEGDQFSGNLMTNFVNRKYGNIGLEGTTFIWGNDYQGYRGKLFGKWDQKGFRAQWNGSVLGSNGTQETFFLRHKSDFSQSLKFVRIGYKDEHELNQFRQVSTAELEPNSYQFYDWQVYISQADSSKNQFKIFYRQRDDWKSDSLNLRSAARAHNAGASFDWLSRPNSQLKTMVNYRQLKILNTDLISTAPENTLLGRIDYNLRLWKGAVTLTTFYEIGSGLELRKEFLYIEVNAGQGVYTWNDYNGDGVKDLNEFEIAQFQDQANYIRVFTPSNEYVKTFSNELNQSLFLKPERAWARKKGFLKFMSRFSNQTLFRINRKTSNEEGADAFNPFRFKVSDTTLISLNSTVRNTFYFNRTNSIFGADYTYQDLRSKILLANGFDSRVTEYHQLNLRWNVAKKFTIKGKGELGRKTSRADYTTGRDYEIDYFIVEPSFIYQPSTRFRVALKGTWSDKRNDQALGGEHAELLDMGLELRYNQIKKGSLNAAFNTVLIRYDGQLNSSLAFEMLESLKPGTNFTWSLGYQRNLSKNLQISVQYNGRKSEDNKAIHAGGLEVRAFF